MENDNEIELIDYIKVILKRKNLILGITLGIVIGVGVLSFILPKTYKVDAIIEIGRIESFFPETPGQVLEKIKNKNYQKAIQKKLNISEKEFPKINIFNPKNTGLLIISITSKKPERAKEILENLGNLILKEHQSKFNIQKKILLDDKKRIEKKISFLKEKKKILEEKINYLRNLYQTNPSSENLLLLMESKKDLKNTKLEIENHYLKLNSINQKLNISQPTQIIKPPSIPELPTGPNPLLNIIIALILGFLSGSFLAFLCEWWEKEKERLKT